MTLYSIDTFSRYAGDLPPERLHHVGGPVVGISADRWPRHRGRPMQPSFTIDLQGLELEAPRARGMRALAVFVDSYYELDVDGSEGIAVVWLSQADVDAHPSATPPRDFVAEPLPYTAVDKGLRVEPLAPGTEPYAEQSYLGGQPVWNEDGAPSEPPRDAFVLQVSSWTCPLARPGSVLRVFEDGAHLQRGTRDTQVPMPWPQALARTQQLVRLDAPPAAGALQKWGGLPKGVSAHAWPYEMSHVLTYVPEAWPEGEDGAAVVVFGRVASSRNWGDEEEGVPYVTHTITKSDLEAHAEVSAPKGVPVLEERALELRSLPAGTTWRELSALSFVGPRPAWPNPTDERIEVTPYAVLQLASEILPDAPGRGSLVFLGGGFPMWISALDAPQTASEPYVPHGTLYETDTTAAIVAGYRIGFEAFELPPERVEALDRSLAAALEARGLDLAFYVPGDTTDREREIQATFVLGAAVASVEANDPEPTHVDVARARRLLSELPELDDAFWAEALAGFEGATPDRAPALHLLSWGPLCYAALHAGVAWSSDRADEATHGFFANQDMSQERSPRGIDGVYLVSVEFSGVKALELRPTEDLAKAAPLEGAGYWLLCRYD